MLDEKTWTDDVLNIFILDENSQRAEQLEACLQGGSRSIKRVDELSVLIKAVDKNQIDLLFLAEELPSHGGASELCSRVRERMTKAGLPILIVCEELNATARIRAYDAGASDIISSTFDTSEIEYIARHHLGLRKDRLKNFKERDRLVLLEKMNALGFMAAGVAHEVANPIGFISVSTENLEADLENFKKFLFKLIEEEADEELLETFRSKLAPISAHLDIIQDGCSRIRNITRELQTFARHRPQEVRTVHISNVVSNVFGLVKTRFKRRASFACNEINRLTVKGQAAELTQAFLSLVLNAVEAIVKKQDAEDNKTPGKVTVSIRILGDKGMVEVSDTGSGISKDEKNMVFQPGYTTKEDVVTGMGLSLARSTFEDHGGRLRVLSRPGEGATFIVELPVGAVEEASPLDRFGQL